ncbi:MAG: DNA (cytosine-5-)-methyltransferase [Candidatus Fonsibacter ubiquis]
MITVLSLFDGISGAKQALKELNIDCEYYASEIDRYAIQVAKNNHPDIIHIGDVKGIEIEDSYIFYNQNIDLLIGGSPCQDLSIAKKDRKGLNGERSSLFYEYLRILNGAKPKYFILENVASMPNDAKNEITKNLFGIEPILINSSLLTAQQRKRMYWVGSLQEDGSYKKIDIKQPDDKGILLKDILENGLDLITEPILYNQYNQRTLKDKSATLSTSSGSRTAIAGMVVVEPVKIGYYNKGGQGDRIYSVKGKSVCLSANGGGRGAKTGLYKIDLPDGDYIVRKLTPNECARLQGFPDNYCQGISNTQAYKCFGNSFTVPVIKHILQQLNLF